MSEFPFPTPNCDKLLEAKDKSSICSEFYDFLALKYVFANYEDQLLYPENVDPHNLIAEFLGINPVEYEKEKARILDYQRYLNDQMEANTARQS